SIPENGTRNGIFSLVRGSTKARTEYLKDVLNSRHICVRELLKIFVPGRWQAAEILEDVCRHYGHQRLHLPEFTVENLFPGIDEATISISGLPRGSWSAPATDQ